jgi:isoquinoline 1-oxidoreductase beta subunit
MKALSRRSFMKLAAGGGAALMIGFGGRRLVLGESVHPSATALTKWIRIDPNGLITLTIGKMEMGQGVRTTLSMILADELDADWSRIVPVNGTPGSEFPGLGTGGSGSTSGMWKPLRKAAAAAREMLVAAAAAKWKVDPASCQTEKSFVIHAPSKRRLGYGELVGEAAKLPLPAEPKLKAKSDFRLIGTAHSALDGKDIVSGRARFGCDARVPGMLIASIERPPWTGAKAKGMNEKAALAVRGVRAVKEVNGGYAVVADSNWATLKGRSALAVQWEEAPADAFDSATHRTKLAQAASGPGVVIRKDTPPTDLPAVTRTIEAEYYYPFYTHAPLETLNCLADVKEGRCDIHVSTQAPNSVQQGIAERLGLKTEDVHVTPMLIGGGFGQRLGRYSTYDAADLSRELKAPVQVLYTRADDMRHGHFQGASVHKLSAGLTDDHRVISWRHTKAGSFHTSRNKPKPEDLAKVEFHRGSAWGVYDLPYVIPDIETSYAAVDLAVVHGPWRSVFAPSSIFAREGFIDELAILSGADPIAFRLDLLRGPDQLTASDVTIDRRRLRRVLETVRDKSGWPTPLAGTGRGRGVACNVYDGETYIAYVVEVTVDAEHRVHVDRVVNAVDCGLVVNPVGVEQQMEGGIIWGLSSALKGNITFKGGAAEQSSYADYPVAHIQDAPVIETHIIASEFGEPCGMGEPPVPPISPAIVNAVFAATGKRIRKVPLRPEDLV